MFRVTVVAILLTFTKKSQLVNSFFIFQTRLLTSLLLVALSVSNVQDLAEALAGDGVHLIRAQTFGRLHCQNTTNILLNVGEYVIDLLGQ